MKSETKTLLLMAVYVAVLGNYLQSATSLLMSYFEVLPIVMYIITLLCVVVAYLVTELIVRRWKISLLTKAVVLGLMLLLPILALRVLVAYL